MSKKEKFIRIIQTEIFDRPDIWSENYPEDFNDALTYFNALKGEGGGKPAFTENGRLVLSFVQKHYEDYNNLMKAKDVGEGMGISSRTVSGAMRKLTNDGYIEKMGENPVCYAITEKGINVNLKES